MGWWRSEHGIIGDSGADILGAALKKIVALYQQQCGRLPTQGELANLIEFNTCGCLVPTCGDSGKPYDQDSRMDGPMARETGFQGVCGPASVQGRKAGELAYIDPRTSKNFRHDESNKMFDQQGAEAG